MRRLVALWPILVAVLTAVASYGASGQRLVDLERRMAAREAVTPTHSDIATELGRTNGELAALTRELAELRQDVRELRTEVMDLDEAARLSAGRRR